MGKHTIIIGGGGIGSASACFLSAMAGKGDTITVIERDPSYQSASSSLSASSIRHQFSTPVNVELSRFGWEFMRACNDGGGAPGCAVGLFERGYLFLGRAHQQRALQGRAQRNRAMGSSLQEFTQQELAARYTWMQCADLAYASLGTAGEGWFDGYMLQQVYRSRARAGGVRYVQGNATALRCKGSRVQAVELADGSTLEGDIFVNAAGAWSAAVARMVGVELPVHARRRSIFVVSCPQHIADFPILIDASGIFVRPEQNHYLCALAPPPERDQDDLPLDPDFTLFEDTIWPTLAERIPAFEALRVERAWAGYYEYNTADHNGLVGQIGPDNFFVATGFSGHGLMHSAGVGRGVAELLCTGTFQTIDLAPLSPHRLAGGNWIVEDAVY